MFIQYNDGVEVHDSTSTQVWGSSEDSDCTDEKEKAENAGKCPSSCQRDIDCLIASCSDCAVVDVVCDEEIDTAAYPHLAGKVNDEVDSYDDLELADVPAEKKLQAPFGDSGLFEIMGIQAALVIIGATQGIGAGELPRVGATGLFSMTLTMAWLFSLACFDVMGIDVTVAGTLLQLRPIEGAALFFIGILVLSVLAAYVISEQNKPSRTAVKAVFDTFSVAMVGAYFCTARIIWVARRKRRSKVSSDDDPPA